jgi:hypothetical protein
MMDIDKITKRIINIIKNDYLIDLDEDEEMGLTSDIADILQDKHNELTTLLIKQRDLIDRCIFHKMYPACCTDKIQVFENREQYMNFIKINNTIWEKI